MKFPDEPESDDDGATWPLGKRPEDLKLGTKHNDDTTKS